MRGVLLWRVGFHVGSLGNFWETLGDNGEYRVGEYASYGQSGKGVSGVR